MTRDDLIAFESEIASLFNAGKIPHPVHLSDGNEDQLIAVFEQIDRTDWVLGSWRMHYHALLHGVPRETLKEAIIRGDGMALSFPEHRLFGSAIVGGTLPVALGIAMANKRAGSRDWVHVFCGDMTAETGIFHECIKYGSNHGLRIRFIVEDNGISVCTGTRDAWGRPSNMGGHVERYFYASKYPHAGAGHRVQF